VNYVDPTGLFGFCTTSVSTTTSIDAGEENALALSRQIAVIVGVIQMAAHQLAAMGVMVIIIIAFKILLSYLHEISHESV